MNDITLHRNLPAMIAAYDESKRLITDGFASIARAREVWEETFKMGEELSHTGHLSIAPRRGSHHDIGTPEEALKGLRQQTWSNIVDRIGIAQICSAERRRGMSESIEKDELPEPTVETVSAFLRGQMSELGTIFEEKVKAVFNKLRPHGSRYKRNSEEEVPKSVVLGYMVHIYWGTRYTLQTMSHGSPSADLLEIESVFDTLDGRGNVAKSHHSRIQQAIEKCTKEDNRGETDHFTFACHKNGNLHITFKRLDLLEKLNQIAGGKRLRKTKVGESNLATVAAE